MAAGGRARVTGARRARLRDALGPGGIGLAVLTAGLSAEPVADGPPPPVDDAAWAAWLEVAEAQRLASMTLSAVRLGALAPSPEVVGSLTDLALGEATMSLAAGRAARRTMDALEAAGHHPTLLKGASIAVRFYPRPEDRPTRDVDLFLPEAEVVPAWEVLRSQGHHPYLHGMDAEWVGRYAKGRTLVGPDGTEVDLHRSLTALPFGAAVDRAAVSARARTVELEGRPVRTLDAEATFFHTCLHAALEYEPVVLAHLDVVAVSRAALDLDALGRLVGDGPLTSVVRAAVREAAVYGAVAPAVVDWAAALPPSPAGDRLLDWYRARHRSFVASLVRATPLVGGARERIRYGSAVLVGLGRMAVARRRPGPPSSPAPAPAPPEPTP